MCLFPQHPKLLLVSAEVLGRDPQNSSEALELVQKCLSSLARIELQEVKNATVQQASTGSTQVPGRGSKRKLTEEENPLHMEDSQDSKPESSCYSGDAEVFCGRGRLSGREAGQKEARIQLHTRVETANTLQLKIKALTYKAQIYKLMGDGGQAIKSLRMVRTSFISDQNKQISRASYYGSMFL